MLDDTFILSYFGTAVTFCEFRSEPFSYCGRTVFWAMLTDCDGGPQRIELRNTTLPMVYVQYQNNINFTPCDLFTFPTRNFNTTGCNVNTSATVEPLQNCTPC